ncbi:hypothetical protein LINGRAHAP2_LOCUS24283 [Linum grandiflorum]
MMKEKFVQPNAWAEHTTTLFGEFRRHDQWYVADSVSEDVKEESREEDDVVDADDDHTLCPQICFTAEEKAISSDHDDPS